MPFMCRVLAARYGGMPRRARWESIRLALKTSPLHDRFGVEIHDMELREVTAEMGYPQIRAAFEEHSLLLLRDQHLDDESHLRVGELFGPIEVRSKAPRPAAVSPVSNVVDGDRLAGEDEHHLLNMIANQLWHTDSTFLPVPALANILVARVLPTSGGETELVSTRAAFADMTDDLKDRARAAVLSHSVVHSRRLVSDELAGDDEFAMWADERWRAVWPNPVNGAEALYIASHAFAVDGLPDREATALITELVEWSTRDDYLYCHDWIEGDVLIWD